MPSAYGFEHKNLLALLEQNHYAEIEDILTEAASVTEKNPAHESVLNNYLDQFYTPIPSLEKKLDDWVSSRNTSYIPHLVRGIYYTSLGWNQRGTRYISETGQNQIDGMHFYFEKAYKDFAKSLEIEPRQVHSQSYLIEILMNFNQQNQIEALLNSALTYRSDSLTVRWYYLSTLLPRWGGSIEKMSSFVDSTRPHFETNPALKILEGRVKAEMGDQNYFAGKYQQALKLYSEALKTGDHWYYLKQRGEVLLRVNQYQEAIADLSNAIKIRPNYWRAYDQRGVAYMTMEAQNPAISDLTVAIDHLQGGARVINARGESYLALKKYDKALNDFEKAVKIDPNDADYRTNRNRVITLIDQR